VFSGNTPSQIRCTSVSPKHHQPSTTPSPITTPPSADRHSIRRAQSPRVRLPSTSLRLRVGYELYEYASSLVDWPDVSAIARLVGVFPRPLVAQGCAISSGCTFIPRDRTHLLAPVVQSPGHHTPRRWRARSTYIARHDLPRADLMPRRFGLSATSGKAAIARPPRGRTLSYEMRAFDGRGGLGRGTHFSSCVWRCKYRALPR
jgi:hypothetical protein